MTSGAFIDFYEALQISPNADPETVHRVFRILAQRYHPDNPETGDSSVFRLISEAYEVLKEAESRAAYDVHHRDTRRLSWKIFDQSNSAQGVEAERRKRQGVLSLLYRKRMMQPDQSGMTLKDFEELLGVPKEHLEFTMWFLKENQCLTRADNGRHFITIKGVEVAEEMCAERRTDPMLLTAAARVA